MCVIKKVLFFRAVLVSVWLTGLPVFIFAIDPFSKITIISQQVRCYQAPDQKKVFVCDYEKDVKATFADNSVVTANLLTVLLDTKKTATADQPTNNKLSLFKSITFQHNVKVVREKNIVTADRAEMLLHDMTCRFFGNVCVEQNDQKVPIVLKSNEAFLNLKTNIVTFSGSQTEPVSTIINLEKHAEESRQRRAGRIRKKRCKKT
ncbi:hypothetical protein IPF37_03760 [bacterium]|nr:MAG: hypothetical protein IPF37_03760 [bacterium]